ncbi:protein FAM227A isoform X4 [Eublepharis macularius]|uniref:Protein FAM227A isoform X4 n=1 Tax=Eublepharis macularius TaxID=481883 RepID=A0AA97L6U2_EUBMA|nr:protein FAM227A isoform X4 [Eublepharis macularius]
MEFIPTDSFVSPLKGFLVLSPATQEKKNGTDTTYSKLDDKPRRYVIGTMQKVNQKITDFKTGLQKFDSSDMVIEDASSKRQSGPKRARQISRQSRGAEKEWKAIQGTRVSADIRLQSKTAQKKVASEKDKLVELYQYPGYNKQELTPLPNGLELEEIVEKVIRAQRRTPVGKFFPSLLSQTVYTCFCSCFTRSWFNTREFKAQLCDVFSEWLGGTLHAPGEYNRWDYSQLEPERSRREDILSGKSKLGTDDEDPFGASKISGRSKKSSRPSSQVQKRPQPSKKTVSMATQGFPKPSQASRNTYQQPSPSRESTYYHFHSALHNDLLRQKDSWNKQRSTPKRRLKITYLPRESHPACCGPEFTWHLLNIGGCSPLVQHFLQIRNCEPKAGCDIFVSRREICKPLPDSAETYADVIKQSFSILQQRHKAYKKAFLRHWREMKNFDQQCKENQELFRYLKGLQVQFHYSITIS